MIIGGHGWNGDHLSDIEAISLDEDNFSFNISFDEDYIICDPTDLPYKVNGHASVYSPVLNGVVTCGGQDFQGRGNWNYLSKCILQRKGFYSNHFPSLKSKRLKFSLTSISHNIYAIGGLRNENTMETINLNFDREWKKEEMPFSVQGHCSAGLGNSIIVTGGRGENYNVSKIILSFT